MLEAGYDYSAIADHYGVSRGGLRSRIAELRAHGYLTSSDERRANAEPRRPTHNSRAPVKDLAVEAVTKTVTAEVRVECVDKKRSVFDVLEYLQHKIREQDILHRKDSGQGEATIHIHTDKPFAVAFSADWHLGSAGVDYATFLDHVRLILETPNLFVGTVGDLVDNFVKSRMKSAMLHALFGPQEQYDVVREIFRMLGDKMLWHADGNHDAWTDDESGVNMLGMMLSEAVANVPYLPYGGGINLVVNDGKVVYRIFAKHKYRFNSSFNATHGNKRMHELESPYDVGVTAHTHNPSVEHTHRWNGVYGKDIIHIVCGTYKVSDPYAAANGYGQSSWIAVPVVVFYPDEKRMIPFYHLEDAVEILKGWS